MANWKRTLKIGDLHTAYQAGNLTAAMLGQDVAKRLKALNIPADGCIEEIAERLGDVDDIEEYDDAYGDLCNWGDRGHRLWVDVFSKPKVGV